jgi:condensin complex subunit 3
MVHMELATSILRVLFKKDMPSKRWSCSRVEQSSSNDWGVIEGSDKKVLCQALNKLFLPSEMDDDDRVRTLKLLVHNLRTRRPPRDASAVAALVKFDGALSKRFEKQLEDFNESEYRQLQSLQELFEFLDDIMPLDEDDDGDEEDEAPAAKKRVARKRRSESVTSDATSITDEWARTPARGKSGKAKSKYDYGLH